MYECVCVCVCTDIQALLIAGRREGENEREEEREGGRERGGREGEGGRGAAVHFKLSCIFLFFFR